MQRILQLGYGRSLFRVRTVIFGLGVLLLSGGSSPAAADQFTIRSGSGVGDDSGGVFSVGGDGFSFLFGGDSTGSVSDLGTIFCGERPCAPATMDFNRLFTDFLGFGSAVIGGLLYDDLTYHGEITVNGGITSVGPGSDGWTVAEAPFFLTALLNGSTSAGSPVFSHMLTGQGQAAAYFRPTGTLDSVVLTFEDPVATPEPSTFLLFGFGAAALARLRRRSGLR